jgi:3-phosphoshikimate 1-carboxyvinyltransferase
VVRVTGISRRWPQADLAALDLLEATGAAVVRYPDGAAVTAGPRKPFCVDLTDAPDLYPLAGVLAATAPGRSRILGAEHVATKESDRKGGTALLARRLGAHVTSTAAGLVVEGRGRARPVRLPALSDHRMVMSATVGALAADEPSVVGSKEAVRKSFPGFWTVLRTLSGGRAGP